MTDMTAADRAAVLEEAADAVDNPPLARAANATDRAFMSARSEMAAKLRRLAAEAVATVCAECDHPKDAHREGDDPVTPGTCTHCDGDDAHHDYEPGETPATTEPRLPDHTVNEEETPDLPDRLAAALTERFTELGNPFSEMRRHEQGLDGWPASHPVGPRHVAEVLRELLAHALPAVVEPAEAADETDGAQQ